MKVTFMEEIEVKHAWRECMYCSNCNSGTYRIHEQIMPYTDESWWVECAECGYESRPSMTREGAITRWKQSC